jgi:sensor domain CHASE-containing protein
VRIELEPEGQGILGWCLRGLDPVQAVDGLPTEVVDGPDPVPSQIHPNGAVGLDHVVVLTPRFERTAAALAEAALELRRIREAPGGIRQGFRRLGPAILEVVEAPDQPDGPARFWGLVVTVSDLDALAERLGERLGRVRPAVQPGRRIATLRESAGLGEAVAFMSV